MKRRRYVPYLYLLPAIVMFLAFIVYPLGDSLVLSFTDYNLATSTSLHFVGPSQYVRLFARDATFLTALLNQVKYGIPFFVLGLILSFFLALFMNHVVKGRSFFQIVTYMPLIIPNSIAAIIFVWIFDNTFGIANFLLHFVHVRPPQWFNDPHLTIYMFAPINLWITVGFPTMIFFNGLQTIPTSLYEASVIAGSNFLKDTVYITVPLMRNYIVMVCVWLLINSLKLFDLPYILTSGGPGISTYTMYYYSWSEAFQSFHLGTASAAAFINGIMILLLSWLINKLAGEAV